MSQENVEIVLTGLEAFARGDLAAAAAILDPHVEWSQLEEPEPAIGPEAALEAIGRWTEMWDDVEEEVREVIDAENHVLLLLHWSGRNSASEVPIQQSAYNLYTVRDGKVVRMREYAADSRTDALDAVGLSE